jgi:Glycine rich protein
VAVGGCFAVTDRATNVGAFSAQLNAHGRTDASPAHYYFQYALTRAALGTAGGRQTPIRGPIPPNVPGNGSELSFGETASRLTPQTKYYFRVCGGDGSVTPDVCSRVRSFTTRAGVSFSVPGSYSWTVPAGVTRATFDVYGAGGGRAAYPKPPSPAPIVTGMGGMGAHVRATLSVQAGQTLTAVVGGLGGDAPGSAGGFNGGAGGHGDIAGVGGGGGGASDVRTGPSDTSGLSSRLLVAGGGGGASTLTGTDARGGDGGLVGRNGQAGRTGLGASQGGGGGTANAGGAGGTGATGPLPPTDGASGALGLGGQGAVAPRGNGDTSFGAGGGGGAGGLYGGGGGGGGGFAADAGFEPPGAGGGGSSLATVNTGCQPTVTGGVESGNGTVTITYNPPAC